MKNFIEIKDINNNEYVFDITKIMIMACPDVDYTCNVYDHSTNSFPADNRKYTRNNIRYYLTALTRSNTVEISEDIYKQIKAIIDPLKVD